MNIKWVCIVAGVMALAAILPTWPYNYYVLLRWVLCAGSAVVAWNFYESKLNGWALGFVGIGILFNPIFPIYLSRSTWAGLDLVTAVLFFVTSQRFTTK